MKYALLLSLIAFSFNSFAATCKLSSAYNAGFDCAVVSTKLTVEDEQQCRAIAERTKDEKFFGILKGKERVIRTKYVFKESKRKVKDTIEFEVFEDVCY